MEKLDAYAKIADERFETGSLGFYAERGERPVLQALRFTFFKKAVFRPW